MVPCPIAGPAQYVPGHLVLDALREELHELSERTDLPAFDLDAAVAEGLRRP